MVLKIFCKTLFLSIEPLHAPVDISDYAHLIDWVIVGGESGHETGKYRYRPCDLDWIRSIIKQCADVETPVFVKQLGTYLSKQMGLKDRHGGIIEEWPEDLQVRQFPNHLNN